MRLNYYDILGVRTTANTDEIRKAFRSKAKLLHPDVNSEPNANEKFRQVNEAYEVLTDVKRRYLFDLQMESLLRKGKKRTVHPRAYGSSKSDPNFHYDWESISKAAYQHRQQKEESRLFRANSAMLQFLYVFGMLMGFVVIGITAWAISLSYWPKITLIASAPGIFMVREGWLGIIGQQTWLSARLKNRKRS
jgi:curved DNA-binding protein CbpA